MDKLLGAVKDFDTIKKYLAAINQTTDDFLFAFDIPNSKIQFFAPVQRFFAIAPDAEQTITLDALLAVVHPSDRKGVSEGAQAAHLGTRDFYNDNFRMFTQSGETVWVNLRGKTLRDENGAPYMMIGRFSEEAVRHLFNPITGLWNRAKLHEDLKAQLELGRGWLMKLGIPALADINLSHGRDFGDSLLCEMANLLEEIDGIEESYHLDRNEFAVILRPCGKETVEEIYRGLCLAMSEKCTVVSGVVPIDNSIFMDVAQLMDSANITLSTAALNPTEQVIFFSPEEITQRISDLTLLEELKESTQNDFEGFEVYYQPQIKSGNYELYGVEALLRYHSKTRGRVFPDEFIPILERSGLINPVGMWVLKESLTRCKKWRNTLPQLQVAVNFSAVQFENPGLGEKIVKILHEAEFPGSALTVELTESVRITENKQLFHQIKYLQSHGIRFSIDDFGTGYSNLGYLKQLDVNEIKIDRSFVAEIEQNTYNYRLISNLIEFAKLNAIHACCEGVETTKELLALEPLQADIFQGYLFDKPCTATEIAEKYIQKSSSRYQKRIEAIEEIIRFKEKFGTIHFNPRHILNENDIGLWIMRIDKKDNRHELHADPIMERVLGLTEKLSPDACYDYWYNRIVPDDVAYVQNAFDIMIRGGKAVQMGYRWLHPTFGEVTVRSSGIHTQDENGKVRLEGYHRILTGVEGA